MTKRNDRILLEELLDVSEGLLDKKLIEYKIPEKDWEDFRDIYSRTKVPLEIILCLMKESDLTIDDIKDAIDGLEPAVLKYKEKNLLNNKEAWTKALITYVKKGGMDIYRTRDILTGNYPMQRIKRIRNIPSISYY
ncbi:MAG: hypothetical protein QXO27_03425 [Candidatus Aenigmatarchaeota archaeon]